MACFVGCVHVLKETYLVYLEDDHSYVSVDCELTVALLVNAHIEYFLEYSAKCEFQLSITFYSGVI